MGRPHKKTTAWKAFQDACLRTAPDNYKTGWVLSHAKKSGSQVQGGVMKHIMVALNDDDDPLNELTAVFAEQWEANQIQTRRSNITGAGATSAKAKKGKTSSSGDAMVNEFSFAQMGKLRGLPNAEKMELLKEVISGAKSWADVVQASSARISVLSGPLTYKPRLNARMPASIFRTLRTAACTRLFGTASCWSCRSSARRQSVP